jgi:hypothetical protein
MFGKMTPRHVGPHGANYQPELPKTKGIPVYININNINVHVTLTKNTKQSNIISNYINKVL